MVNEAIAEYTPSGVLIGENSLTNFFADPASYGDVRCVYDPSTQSFYFTQLSLPGFTGGTNTYGGDLLQLNTITGSRSEYYFDFTDPTDSGCPCLGDQMRIGFDGHAIYLTADEYPLFGPGDYGQGYNGSEFYAISKQDVVTGNPTPVAWFYRNLVLGSTPVLGLVPAVSANADVDNEWMLNSFPYTSLGNNNPIANTLGLWHTTGDVNIETTAPSLYVKVISTESYAFPVAAISTNYVTCPGILCAGSLNTDDDRVNAVEYMNGHVYTAFETSFNVPHNINTYDGAAWFDINSSTKRVSAQGYIAFAGDYLTYPALWRSSAGTTAVTYTVTNSGLNPSAAYSARDADYLPFSPPHVVATGASPYYDFAYRWGDYSWAGPDPATGNIWMATEYVPPLADQGFFANWGTYVFRN